MAWNMRVFAMCVLGSAVAVAGLRHNPHKTFQAIKNSKAFQARASSCETHPVPVPLTPDVMDDIQTALQAVDAAVKTAFKQSGVPGISIGIVYNQTLLWSQGYGVVNLNGSAPAPDENTLYRIGSVSKVFADLATLQVRDEGLIELDDAIEDYVDFSMMNPWPLEKPITFRELGSHLAGTPRSSPCNAIIGDCDYTTDEIFARFANESYIQPPNIQPSYSNAGFALLGHTLEAVTGVPYADYVVENILQPLNMMDTGFNYTADVVSRIATGYISSLPNAPAPLFDLGWESPAGQMYSSVADLAKLASYLFTVDVTPYDTFDQSTPGGPDLINRTSIRESMLPTWMDDSGTAGFGLPWEIYQYNNYWLLTKGGDVLGYTASFFTLPASKLAFIALSASDGYEPSGFNLAAMGAFVPTFEAILTQLQPAPVLPSYASQLVGIYPGDLDPAFAATANVSMNAQTGRLHVQVIVQTSFGGFPFLDADLSYDPVRGVFMTDGPAAACQSAQANGGLQYVNFAQNADGVWTVSVPGLFWATFTMQQQQAPPRA